MTRSRPRVAALLASVVLATAGIGVTTGPAVASEADALRAEAAESITVEDLRSLVAQFEATGEVTFAGARRMEATLALAEHYIKLGVPALAVHGLELFKQVAATPRYVPSASARDQLLAAADQLIAQLSETP